MSQSSPHIAGSALTQAPFCSFCSEINSKQHNFPFNIIVIIFSTWSQTRPLFSVQTSHMVSVTLQWNALRKSNMLWSIMMIFINLSSAPCVLGRTLNWRRVATVRQCSSIQSFSTEINKSWVLDNNKILKFA